jgi:hypothetical protein
MTLLLFEKENEEQEISGKGRYINVTIGITGNFHFTAGTIYHPGFRLSKEQIRN